jgi:predicted CopG family antitoxin
MGLLDFDKPEKKDATLTVRIRPSMVEKLNEIKEKYEVSQSDVIEQLIEKAYEEMLGKKKK